MLNFLAAVSGNGAGATGSFESIATTTLSTATATVTFSSIPSTYQHLQIRVLGRANTTFNSGENTMGLRFNNDSGANYSVHRLKGNGSGASAANDININYLYAGYLTDSAVASNIFGANIIDIHDYKSTTKNKTVRIFGGTNANTTTTDFSVVLGSGFWNSTNAINSISISADIYSSTWAAGSTFALYGIKGA